MRGLTPSTGFAVLLGPTGHPSRPPRGLRTFGALRAGVLGVLVGGAAFACHKSDAPQTGPSSHAPSDCSPHAACGDHFFIDTESPHCEAGFACSVVVTLSARDAFHLDDDYPYVFKADTQPGMQFMGSDSAGREVFSKAAGDWQKLDDNRGTMTVGFVIGTPGERTIGGKLKLRVCSGDKRCAVEERDVRVTVRAI
jgi:hypothetical protein